MSDMYKLKLLTLLFIISSPIYSGTLMDATLKNYHPYLADKDGFNSLFVNPAGMAGISDIFNFEIQAGGWGNIDNIVQVFNLMKVMSAMANPEKSITADNVNEILPYVSSDVSEQVLDSILKGTTLEGTTAEDLVKPETLSSWKSGNPTDITTDIKTMQNNLSDTDLQAQIMNEFNKLNFNLEAAVRLGTLIKGVGIGIYTNAYTLLSVGALGIDDAIFEVGGLLGYGFNVGRFSFGFRGGFSLFLVNNQSNPFSIDSSILMSQFMKYGNAWGLDIGGIWEPVDGIRLGFLLNDIIGNQTKMADLEDLSLAQLIVFDFPTIAGGYNFLTDISLGATFERPRGIVRPKFSLDVNNIVGMIRAIEGDYTGVEQYYSRETNLWSRYLRVGGGVKFFNIFDVNASYYMDYFAFGLGVNLFIIEFYAEIKTNYDFNDLGATIMFKLKF